MHTPFTRPLRRLCSIVFALLATAPGAAHAVTPTVGLVGYDPARSFAGYTLFSPSRSDTTYLVANDGRLVHSWTGATRPALSAYLLDDGSVLRTGRDDSNPTFSGGGSGGLIERIAWDGTVLWSTAFSTPTTLQHHDIEPMPNGNVLVAAWELRTHAEAIQAGRDPALLSSGELWPDTIVEIAPDGPASGQIVWEWRAWDHLVQDFDPTKDNHGVVADHPELIDVNYFATNDDADWLHFNAVDYEPVLDQILFSARGTSEIYVIDHSTTTAEAAGHTGGASGMGGDILYRWGNPEAYDTGSAADRTLWFQHDPRWIEPGLPGAGNILVFNNGGSRPGGPFSSVDEIVPPVSGNGGYALTPGAAFEPTAPVWSYVDPVDPTLFFARLVSGATRLPNGNTLVCSGPTGTFFEVTPGGETVWEYVNPVGSIGPVAQGDANSVMVFRAERVAAEHPGLVGRDLSGGPPIETYPPDGDFDDDGDVDATDWIDFEACHVTGGVVFPTCVQADFDHDGAFTCADGAAFALAWTDPAPAPVLTACATAVPALQAPLLIALGMALAGGGAARLRA